MKVFCEKRNEVVEYNVCCQCQKYDECPERQDASGVRVIGITIFSIAITILMITIFLF